MRFKSVASAALDLGLSAESVRNRCSNGTIPGATMTGTRWLVPEEWIVVELKGRADDETQLEAFLIDLARKRKTTTYTEAGTLFGFDMRLSNDRRRISVLLDAVSRKSHAEYGLMLSVLVQHKGGLPGAGFGKLALALGKTPDAEVTLQFVSREMELVFSHWQSL